MNIGLECICIINTTGYISFLNNEFHYATNLKINDCIYDQIDRSINTADDFINKIQNIHLQNDRFNLHTINHEMIASNGLVYTLEVSSRVNHEDESYISMIIRNTPSLIQRLKDDLVFMRIPLNRKKIHYSSPINVLVVHYGIEVCEYIQELFVNTIHHCDYETGTNANMNTNANINTNVYTNHINRFIYLR